MMAKEKCAAAISVLLVEDNPLIADTLVLILEEAGFDALWTAAAEDAISAMAGGTIPDALITDIHLGAGQPAGWDVANAARLHNPLMPVLFITGDSAHQWRSKGVPRSEIFTKPFRFENLIDALRRLMGPSN